MRLLLFLSAFLTVSELLGQSGRWQQGVRYEMEIDFDVKTHRFEGIQRLTYFNRSPDELDRVFYHLYFNAFQPGSAMDVRSRNIPDPDFRIMDKIFKLKPEETGYQKILSLTQNGEPVSWEVAGTILEVTLARPILPGDSVLLEMKFEAQVPKQTRRSGRDNAEGISYSMAQWYPKICQYDEQGWHANPYIAREFYGVFGDFDVKISIDKSFVLAGTGYLQNPSEIGHGYAPDSVQTAKADKKEKLNWHFFAPQVNDFVWTADPDYQHRQWVRKDGLVLHFFYQKQGPNQEEWAHLPPVMDSVFTFLNKKYGPYPYRQFSFIQGGDGGMEYPMATLITGNRPFGSLVGVSVHELAHSWYPMVLGSNEALHAWMDEGFATFISDEAMNYLKTLGLLPGQTPKEHVHAPTYAGYVNLRASGLEEPLSIHADHFQTNYAYGQASYDKGSVFLHQLSYVTGQQAFDKGMLDYFDTWKFRHPNPNDFIRCMEKASGLELDWYKEYFVNTTHSPDYAIDSLKPDAGKGSVAILSRIGRMPMPVDVSVTTLDGKTFLYSIPLDIMRGAKPMEKEGTNFTVAPDWMWVQPTYELALPFPVGQIKTIEIDPSLRLADINRADNLFPAKPVGTE